MVDALCDGRSVLAVVAHGCIGILLGTLFHVSPRVRGSPCAQIGALSVMLFSFAGTLKLGLDDPGSVGRPLAVDVSFQGFIFLAASLCYLPVVLYLVLARWSVLIEYLTVPCRERERRERALSPRQEWMLVQEKLSVLAQDPLDWARREELAEVYLRLGFVDSAVSELRKAVECLERGHAQARLMYKAARLLVDQKTDITSTLPLLRRLVRLYPKSSFAGYARQVLNRHEAPRVAER
jgi:hypothetical protein